MFKAAMIKDQVDLADMEKIAEIDKVELKTNSKNRVYAIRIKTAMNVIEKYDITDVNSILKSAAAIKISPPPEPVNSLAKHFIKQAAIYHGIQLDLKVDKEIVGTVKSNLIKESDINDGGYYTFENEKDYLSRAEMKMAMDDVGQEFDGDDCMHTMEVIKIAEDNKRSAILKTAEHTNKINHIHNIENGDAYIRFYEIINDNRGFKENRIKIAGYRIDTSTEEGRGKIGDILLEEYNDYVSMVEKLSAIKELTSVDDINPIRLRRMVNKETGPLYQAGITKRIKLASTDELKDVLKVFLDEKDSLHPMVVCAALDEIDRKFGLKDKVTPPIETVFGGTTKEASIDKKTMDIAGDQETYRKIEGLI